MAETLTFKSWERPKLFDEDPAHPFIKVNGRLKGALKITVRDKETGNVADDEAPFTLLSATDVTGLVTDRAIKHMAPAPGCMDAETTKLVHIDLWDTGLPWRYTPEKNIDDQKPWLILLVGTAEEVKIKGGIVNVTDDAVFLEHDLKDSHLWAHTQTAANNVKISRILSPRGIKDKKGLLPQHNYVAVLVPAFNDEGNNMWNVNAGVVERKFGKKGVLPAFHYWSFMTAEGGDFETLATALTAPDAGNVGISQLHYTRDIVVDNVHVKEKLQVGGAITSLKTPPNQQASIDTVRADLDILNNTLPNSIGLPQYGMPWVQNPDEINIGWPGELNDDPRFRGIAGLGLWMGVEAQEDLMDAAVKQAGALREAGQRIGNLALGLMASGSLWDKRLPTDKNQRLRILGPMMGRMLAQGGGLVLDKIASGTSPLDKALFSSAAQRVLRDRSVQTRNISDVSGGINYTEALNEANQGEQIPGRAPNGLPHLDSILGAIGIETVEELFGIDQKRIAKIMEQIIKAVKRFCDGYRRKRDDMIESGHEAEVPQMLKERAIALLEKLTGFLQQLLQENEMPCLDNRILSTITSPDGEGNSEYIRRVLENDLFQYRFFDEINIALMNCMGMTPCRAQQANNPFAFENRTLCDDLLNNLTPEHVPDTFPIDLGILSDALIAALDPRQAEPPAKVRLCSRLSGVACTLLRPEFPIGLDYPTWVLLKKYDKEWLLPGVNGLPKDSVVACQTNLVFIDAFMVGINTQFMSEMRWRDLAVSRTCTPLRMFWGQVNYVTKKREADINVFSEWAKNTGEVLGSAALQSPAMAHGNSLVIVFRSDLFRRYPQTLVYLVKPAAGDVVDDLLKAPPKLDHTEAERPDRKYFGPTFVGSITPEITFFSFDVEPKDVDQYWLVLDEPPSELRFVNRNAFNANDHSAVFANKMLDKPTRVAISGNSLEIAANRWSTYNYRNSRQQNIVDALAGLSAEQVDLKKLLEDEQSALQTDDWTATDETFEAVAADWLWNHLIDFTALLNNDPVLLAKGSVSSVTPLQAVAIGDASVPHITPFPPVDYLAKVLVAVDNDEAILSEIVQAAHQIWLLGGEEVGDYPFDDVGVLLPVRLETLFDGPASKNNDDPERWKLSIRVVPDEASVCRDNSFVSKDEIKALVAFWGSIQQPGALSETWLDGDDAKVAWKQLSTRIRPERASWLASNLEVQLDVDDLKVVVPADMPEAMQANRVGGMPPELNLFAVTTGLIDGENHHAIGRLPMDKDKQINNDLLILELPSQLNKAKDSWWASWEEAKKVGLGGEFLLPIGMTPINIEALYVVGIGEEKPDDHFSKQSIAGELSIAKPGVATNTVQGKNAGDPMNWLEVTRTRLANRLNPAPQNNVGSKVQLHLTGKPDAIPFFPGSDATDDTHLSHRMVRALWPALCGEWLKDVWGLGDKAHQRAQWAFQNLYPEGPLMPLRISNQPYGLLPVTSLEQWQVEAGPPEVADQQKVESEIARSMNRIRSAMANAVKDKRSVVGKTSREFMNLLGQPSRSKDYMGRNFLPFGTPMSIYKLTPDQQQQYSDQTFKTYEPAISLMEKKPADFYICMSNGYKLRLPLIQTTNTLLRHRQREFREPMPLVDLITLLVNFPDEVSEVNYDLDEFFPNRGFNPNNDFQIAFLPDSLLIRLMVHACQTGYLWHRAEPGNPLLQRLLDVQQKESMKLAVDIDRDEWRNKEEDKATGNLVFNAIIPEGIRKQWEHALTATLDSAAQRIDPWVTGFAWQRLNVNSRSPRHNHRLGVYGWVDGPFNGVPGPTPAGLLHAPSYNQALASLIMRDKFLSSGRSAHVNDMGNNPWQMNITSRKVRLAEELAEEVRTGCHIYEVIGRHVENIIGKRQTVVELRTNVKYAMHPDRKDLNEVCNGKEALAGLLAGDPAFTMLPQQTEALQLLKDALDTYSDLLMADGVVQVINRQMDRAAETMDAAAGESRPPSFDFIRTPPSGYQLETLVLSAIPFVAVEDLPEKTHPIRLADASVAAFVENKMGNAWTWSAINEDDNAVLGSADLAALGFEPADVLFLSDEWMRELVRYKLKLPLVFISEGQNREWNTKDGANNITGTLSIKQLGIFPDEFDAKKESDRFDLIRTKLGVAAGDTVQELMPADLRLWIAKDENGTLLGIVDSNSLGVVPGDKKLLDKSIRQNLGIPKVLIKSPREHQLAQQLVSSLGNRPASGRDLSEDKSAPVATDIDIYEELKNRYNTLYNACVDIIGKLNDAGNDDATRANLLRRALPWGVVPASDPANREALMAALLGLPLPVDTTPLSDLTAQVAETLQKRLDSSVDSSKLASAADMKAPLNNHEALKQKNIPDGVPSLSRAISNLASPNAGLTILACWNKPAIENNSGLNTAQPEDINKEWLTVMAAVRAKLAKLEALQLEMNDVFLTWTNSPNDPWRTGDGSVIKQNLKKRETQSVTKISMTRFVAAYGSDATWSGTKVAVGLIDSFNEAVPMPQRKTMSAFGFNAPSARAPQAILLAVPPQPRQRLDAKVLLKILEETRELAHARMARMEDIGELQALVPTMWLKATGPSRVRLEPGPLYIV